VCSVKKSNLSTIYFSEVCFRPTAVAEKSKVSQAPDSLWKVTLSGFLETLNSCEQFTRPFARVVRANDNLH